MDFDKPKVYGDTSITDGLVIINRTCHAPYKSVPHNSDKTELEHSAPYLPDDQPPNGTIPRESSIGYNQQAV